MLLASSVSRRHGQRRVLSCLCGSDLVTAMSIGGSRINCTRVTWKTYWASCARLLEGDVVLNARHQALRRAWRRFVKDPSLDNARTMYCLRYFELLHSVVWDSAKRAPDPLIDLLHRIVAFGTFAVELDGDPARAAGAASFLHPAYLVGRMAPCAPRPTPRHVPSMLHSLSRHVYYHYRQVRLRSGMSVVLGSAENLRERWASFRPIDRLSRLVSHRGDPYSGSRARLLTARTVLPLAKAWRRHRSTMSDRHTLFCLDLGAGTGEMATDIWKAMRRCRQGGFSFASLHFVDATSPCGGRSMGLQRDMDRVVHVEWTTADCRRLLDNDGWLAAHGPFDCVLIARLLTNLSTFQVEAVDPALLGVAPTEADLPCRALRRRRSTRECASLSVRPVRRNIRGGIVMPQFSLNEYFAAIRIIVHGAMEAVRRGEWYLPVRRFNPASLTTHTGRSILAQLMRVCSTVIIEDGDLQAEHLHAHRRQYGLEGTAAVYCGNDGHVTKVNHFVITRPEWARMIKGTRLW